MAAQYEDTCRGTRQAATISGLLLWLNRQAEAGDDALAQPGVDAVRVLTHHGAKGLEWPIVILTDLDKEVNNRLWGISTLSRQGVNAADPLKDRFIRYWPWPFGQQSKGIAVKDTIDASALAQRYQAAALAEAQRLLYVSMTRPREMLVFALKQKAKSQHWLESLNAPWLLSGGADAHRTELPSGKDITSKTLVVGPPAELAPVRKDDTPLFWPRPEPMGDKLPLLFNPSSVGASEGRVLEQVSLGERLHVKPGADWGVVGSAVHACLAASFTAPGTALSEGMVSRVLDGFQVRAHIDSTALTTQIQAIHAWLHSRWPGRAPRAEVPVKTCLPNGQIINGRIDLLLETEHGFVLFDHKSSPLGEDKWGELVDAYWGQLQTYAKAMEAATGKPVVEQWLLFPVAGGAVRCSK